MKRISTIFVKVLCAAIFLFICACQNVVSNPAATATVEPPVSIDYCEGGECTPDKPYIINKFFINSNRRPPDINADGSVNISTDSPVIFRYSWCSKDRKTLDENLKNVDFFFTIDEVSYSNGLTGVYGERAYFELHGTTQISYDRYQEMNKLANYKMDNHSKHPCYDIRVSLDNWEVGENHVIKIGSTVNAAISDGWTDYTPSELAYTYRINATVATVIPPSSTPKCAPTAKLSVNNSTFETMKIFLHGPDEYSFSVPPTGQSYLVCPGKYTWIAVGCSGKGQTPYSGSGASGEIDIRTANTLSFTCK